MCIVTLFAIFGILPLVTATLRNITITDQSPTIFYTPSKAGPANETWNITYSESDSSAWTPGAVGNGYSSHITTFEGASLSFGFKGTAIYVLGTETDDGSSVMTVGSQLADKGGGTDGLVAYKTGLEDKWWPVKLNVTGTGLVAITGIIFTVNIGSDSATLLENSVSALSGSLNAPNPDFDFAGSWTARQIAGPNDTLYPRIDTSTNNNRGTLPPMSNESFVMIYGTVNYDHGAYRIDSTDPLPGWPAWTVPNGNSPWFSFEKVLWFGAVDNGTVSITNLEDGRWVDVARVDIISASESARPANETDGGGGTSAGGDAGDAGGGGGGTSIGLIAGVVVGGVAAIAIVAVLAWLLWRRRKKHQAMFFIPLTGRTHYSRRQLTISGYYQPHLVSTGPGEIDPYRETTEMRSPSGTAISFPDPQLAYAHAGSGSSGSEWGIKPFPIGQDPSARHSNLTASSPHPGHPGLYPSNPSSRSESSNGPHSPGHLMLHSHDGHPQSPPLMSSAKSQARLSSQTNVRQETDAGSVSVIPPSYDPTWAQAHPGPERASMSPDPTSDEVGQNERMEMPDAAVYRPRKQ